MSTPLSAVALAEGAPTVALAAVTKASQAAGADEETGTEVGDIAVVDLGKGNVRPAVVSNSGFPGFDSEERWSLDVDFQAPFGQSSYVLMGATFLLGEDLDPTPWSVRLGLTLPFKNVAGLFVDQ